MNNSSMRRQGDGDALVEIPCTILPMKSAWNYSPPTPIPESGKHHLKITGLVHTNLVCYLWLK